MSKTVRRVFLIPAILLALPSSAQTNQSKGSLFSFQSETLSCLELQALFPAFQVEIKKQCVLKRLSKNQKIKLGSVDLIAKADLSVSPSFSSAIELVGSHEIVIDGRILKSSKTELVCELAQFPCSVERVRTVLGTPFRDSGGTVWTGEYEWNPEKQLGQVRQGLLNGLRVATGVNAVVKQSSPYLATYLTSESNPTSASFRSARQQFLFDGETLQGSGLMNFKKEVRQDLPLLEFAETTLKYRDFLRAEVQAFDIRDQTLRSETISVNLPSTSLTGSGTIHLGADLITVRGDLKSGNAKTKMIAFRQSNGAVIEAESQALKVDGVEWTAVQLTRSFFRGTAKLKTKFRGIRVKPGDTVSVFTRAGSSIVTVFRGRSVVAMKVSSPHQRLDVTADSTRFKAIGRWKASVPAKFLRRDFLGTHFEFSQPIAAPGPSGVPYLAGFTVRAGSSTSLPEITFRTKDGKSSVAFIMENSTFSLSDTPATSGGKWLSGDIYSFWSSSRFSNGSKQWETAKFLVTDSETTFTGRALSAFQHRGRGLQAGDSVYETMNGDVGWVHVFRDHTWLLSDWHGKGVTTFRKDAITGPNLNLVPARQVKITDVPVPRVGLPNQATGWVQIGGHKTKLTGKIYFEFSTELKHGVLVCEIEGGRTLLLQL